MKMIASMYRNSRMCRLVSLVLSLLLPLRVASANAGAAAAACFVTSKYHQTTTSKSTQLLVSSGFSFQDGQQVLVSVQKPLGIVLEERQAQEQAQEQHQDDSDEDVGSDAIAGTIIFVAEMDPAGSASRAGVMTGDVLLAVQNASVENRSLEYVMAFLAQAPRVVNLRFLRQTT
jgi:C-terminal processing protease CtpA/Prc